MRVHLATVCLLLVGASTPAFGEDPLDRLLDGDEGISEDFVEDRNEIVLDLNTASVKDLASLPLLSYADAERIVTFRTTHGLFRSPRDLSLVDGLPRAVVEAVLPHVTVSRLKKPLALDTRARARRSSSARGKPLLTGSSLHSRTTYRAGDLVTLSVTTDKDAGEGSPLDFAAGYAEVRSVGWMGRLVAGDFRPGFAQGLVFSRWARVPMDIDQVVRRPTRQVGYRSTEENGALRGIYLEGSKGLWRGSAFGSSARFDAVRDASGQVERLTEGGLHVTATERGRADALREVALGLRVERITNGRSHVGVTALRSGFSPPFKAQERSGYSGASAAVVGVDGGVSLGGMEMAGEVAQTDRRARAWVAGVTFQRRRVKAGVQVRDYDPRFQTLHGAGFSAFGESQNEQGFFAGLAWKARRIRLTSLTFDRAWRPGPTPTLPAGSARASLTFQVQPASLRGLLVRWSGRARWDQTWKGKQAGVVQRRRRSLRMDVVRHVGRGLQVHGRGEFVSTTMGSDREAGGSAFGALRVRWRGVRAEGRLTYFDVPSYESRIFEWEGAPEGMMAFRTLTGRGLKGYGLISVKMGASRAMLRLWRQRPIDGRKATTEVVAQVEVNM